MSLDRAAVTRRRVARPVAIAGELHTATASTKPLYEAENRT